MPKPDEYKSRRIRRRNDDWIVDDPHETTDWVEIARNNGGWGAEIAWLGTILVVFGVAAWVTVKVVLYLLSPA